MKKIIPILIAGILTLGITTTAFAKSTSPNYPRPELRMTVIDPDDGPSKS